MGEKAVATVVTVAAAATVGGLATACSGDEQVASIGYAFDAPITTYNAGTTAGATSGALAAFGRTLTGMSYTGPEGNTIADTDFGTATLVPGDVQTVQYRLDPDSVYSDGVPITCDDLVLAFVAHSGRFTRDGAVRPHVRRGQHRRLRRHRPRRMPTRCQGRHRGVPARPRLQRVADPVRGDRRDARAHRRPRRRRRQRGDCHAGRGPGRARAHRGLLEHRVGPAPGRDRHVAAAVLGAVQDRLLQRRRRTRARRQRPLVGRPAGDTANRAVAEEHRPEDADGRRRRAGARHRGGVDSRSRPERVGQRQCPVAQRRATRARHRRRVRLDRCAARPRAVRPAREDLRRSRPPRLRRRLRPRLRGAELASRTGRFAVLRPGVR